MKSVIFVSGNPDKAFYLQKLLGLPLLHKKLDLEEIQSTSLEEIVTHKVKQAFSLAKTSVVVEDASLGFDEFGGLPGPFIKFFVDANDGLEKLCRIADALPSRTATASCVFGYFDGSRLELLRGGLKGTIAEHPRGTNGFGWDPIFCPDGYGGKTRAELTAADYDQTYGIIKPIAALRKLLTEVT